MKRERKRKTGPFRSMFSLLSRNLEKAHDITVGVLVLILFAVGHLLLRQSGFLNQGGERGQETNFGMQQNLDDEMQALAAPGSDASPGERRSYYNLLWRVAQFADVLVLSENCKTKPVVLAVDGGGEEHAILVENRAAYEQALYWEEEKEAHVVPPNASRFMKLPFSSAGAHRYSCGSPSNPAGVLFAIE